MQEGDILTRKGEDYEVLWGPIPGGSRWPGKERVWARRLSDGQEGFGILHSDWVLTTGCNADYDRIKAITWPNQQAYAEHFGMRWRPAIWSPPKPHQHPAQVSWSRLYDIEACLGLPGVEWVVCLDSDAVFLTTDWWIGDVVGEKSVYLAYQILAGSVFPSCGFMVVRNDTIGRQWVNTLLESYEEYQDDLWCEQAVAYDLLGYDSSLKDAWQRSGVCVKVTEWTDKIGFLPRAWHSTPQDPIPEAVVFHATGGVGVGVNDRIVQLQVALAARSVV